MAARIIYNVANADNPDADIVRSHGATDSGSRILVLNGRGRRFWTKGAGHFSIKWTAHGRAAYRLDLRPRVVSRDRVLLVDHQQPYELEFEGRAESQSFCLFFSPDLVAEAWASVEEVDPEAAAGALRGFPNIAFAPSPALSRLLDSLHAEGPDACATVLEARLLLALGEAVEAANNHRGLADRLPVVKAATRAQLLGQVETARARIAEARGVDCDLETLATEVGLSKFHLLRLFKAVHGVTPIAYAERSRMRAAAQALRSSGAPITAVAAEFGYDSPSAFAKAFRRWTGATPTLWRN